MTVDFVFMGFDECCASIGKFVGRERAHKAGLAAGYITEVVTVFGHNFNGIRIILVVWLRHQYALDAPDIAADTLSVVDACNLQDAKVVVDTEPTAIVATLWQWPMIIIAFN